jgi:hypothetical protein
MQVRFFRSRPAALRPPAFPRLCGDSHRVSFPPERFSPPGIVARRSHARLRLARRDDNRQTGAGTM